MVTHAVGMAFSVGALVTMLALAFGDTLKTISAVVFGVSLIVLYSSSTLYHFSTTLRWKERFQTLDHICIYLLMGWLILLAIVPLWRQLPAAGMGWLVAGGLAYTLGVVFFAWHRLPYNHAIWHLFVLAGSVCHVLAVSLFVFD